MDDDQIITDDELRFLILGVLRGGVQLPQFPIYLREIRDNFDEEGVIESFTIITASGLSYTIHCTFDGQLS